MGRTLAAFIVFFVTVLGAGFGIALAQEDGNGPVSTKPPSKVPAIVQAAMSQISLGGPASYTGPVQVDSEGRIWLEFHAAGAVGEAESVNLQDLGASVESSTGDLVWPEGVPPLEGLGIVSAWVPHDRVEETAQLPWVVAVQPVEVNPPDVFKLPDPSGDKSTHNKRNCKK